MINFHNGLVLIRHQKPSFPGSKVYGKHFNPPLSEEGIVGAYQMGRILGAKLDPNDVTLIMHSGLLRSEQTAKYIAEFFPRAPMLESPFLTDFDSTYIAGQDIEIFTVPHSDLYHADGVRSRLGVWIEPPQDQIKRYLRAVDDARELSDYQGVQLLVGHGDPLAFLNWYWLEGKKKDPMKIEIDEIPLLPELEERGLYPGRGAGYCYQDMGSNIWKLIEELGPPFVEGGMGGSPER